ncbi:hypothetical protein SAMN05444166_0935 [Singulisphaera sp. GP187]|uniref:hypothetical protein n=1 Tax=Singulisphaera sp. GP187 TaxID=1882752 RepID=UPI00092AD90C|nr:hypothetical protein [Singulisphaera sp. GP187]SIN80038.1 hypothetical protein SAMN05444166_0935 [Singulisphaera sp. GP187]
MLWEYYRLSVDGPNVENALHGLGQKGWELVAVIPETRIFYGFQCFLKRPLADSQSQAPERTSYVSARSSSLGQSGREEDAPENLEPMNWTR